MTNVSNERINVDYDFQIYDFREKMLLLGLSDSTHQCGHTDTYFDIII